MSPELHPDLAPVAALLGEWIGDGHGEYPTIEPFDYRETVTFGHVGKPFLAYGQRTLRLSGDAVLGPPLHAESGYWRFPPGGHVEVALSHPTGINELSEGTLTITDGVIVIDVAATTIGRSTTAKSVSEIERTFRLDGDTLSYTVRMAAVGQPLRHHLAATLHRT